MADKTVDWKAFHKWLMAREPEERTIWRWIKFSEVEPSTIDNITYQIEMLGVPITVVDVTTGNGDKIPIPVEFIKGQHHWGIYDLVTKTFLNKDFTTREKAQYALNFHVRSPHPLEVREWWQRDESED